MASTSSDVSSEIKKIATCPACRDYLRDARKLNACNHLMCFECIKVAKISANSIACPVCKSVSQLTNGKLLADYDTIFQRDYSASQLAETLRSANRCQHANVPKSECPHCAALLYDYCLTPHAEMLEEEIEQVNSTNVRTEQYEKAEAELQQQVEACVQVLGDFVEHITKIFTTKLEQESKRLVGYMQAFHDTELEKLQFYTEDEESTIASSSSSSPRQSAAERLRHAAKEHRAAFALISVPTIALKINPKFEKLLDDFQKLPFALCETTTNHNPFAVDAEARLREACETGNLSEIVKIVDECGDDDVLSKPLLLDDDANIERGGWTCLHYAVAGDQAEIVDFLKSRQVNMGARDYAGWTALHHAAFLGRNKALRRLLETDGVCKALLESPVDRFETGGWTPLLLAVSAMRLDAARILLEHGANVETVNSAKETTFFWAKQRADRDMTQLLFSYKKQ